MKRFISAAILFILSLTSCKKDTLIGNGTTETELRQLTGFSKVEVNGKTGVNISYGSAFKVEVKAYRNLLSSLETKVVNDVLIIGYKNGTSVSNDNSEVFITMPLLTKFETTGTSEVTINSGSSDNFEAVITGAGKLNAFGFSVKQSTIIIEGSASASISVTEKLHAKITGSGKVYYKGNPLVTTNITGTGIVEKQ
ncbi:MAG: GIN domain-containing protein [Flavitalea sp.]